jgi:CheY-like chemotaxis protein
LVGASIGNVYWVTSTMDNNSISILVVEDNEDIASGYALFFRKVGFSVCTACNGQEALDSLRERTVDVVISDLGMPEIDGFALAEAIRANARWPKIRRVAVTAQPLDEVEKRARSSGFEAVFQKPAKMCDLVNWIEQNCGLCQ